MSVKSSECLHLQIVMYQKIYQVMTNSISKLCLFGVKEKHLGLLINTLTAKPQLPNCRSLITDRRTAAKKGVKEGHTV